MLAERTAFESKGAAAMGLKNEYIEIGGLAVTYGDIRQEELLDVIPYMVERRRADGTADFAVGMLPYPAPRESEGFSPSEVDEIETLMRDGMPVIYEQARHVGAWA